MIRFKVALERRTVIIVDYVKYYRKRAKIRRVLRNRVVNMRRSPIVVNMTALQVQRSITDQRLALHVTAHDNAQHAYVTGLHMNVATVHHHMARLASTLPNYTCMYLLGKRGATYMYIAPIDPRDQP